MRGDINSGKICLGGLVVALMPDLVLRQDNGQRWTSIAGYQSVKVDGL